MKKAQQLKLKFDNGVGGAEVVGLRLRYHEGKEKKLDNGVGGAEVVGLRLRYHEGKEKKGKNCNNSCTFYFSLPSFHGDVFSRLYARVHSTETSASLSRSLATSPR